MPSLFYSLTHPFEKEPVFMRLADGIPPEMFLPALGYVGWLSAQEVRNSPDLNTTEPTGHISVTFLIDGEERTFTGHQRHFRHVEAADVPDGLAGYIIRSRRSSLAVFRQAERLAEKVQRALSAEREAAQARFNRLFQESNRFWQNWTGTGPPPEDPRTGEKSTERKPPEI